jgi:hypothetical protein
MEITDRNEDRSYRTAGIHCREDDTSYHHEDLALYHVEERC